MSKISPKETKEFAARSNEEVCFIDVRSIDEFRSGHIPGASCIPLQELAQRLDEVPKDKTILLSCQSGARSAKAKELLLSHGYSNLAQVDGGFLAWSAAGFPVRRLTRTSLSLQRQVMLVAGLLVFVGSILGLFVDPRFVFVPLFVGAGLAFAGLSGFCGLARVLERMPWNREAAQ